VFGPMFLSALSDPSGLSLPQILNPQKGTTLSGEIECYSLPYGGLGFASHVMTYWTISCLSLGRRPLWPSSRLRYERWDNWLAILGLVGGTALASFTAIRCRNTWELLVIGIWAMSMSITNGLVGIHASWAIRRAASKSNTPSQTSTIWSSPSLPHMTGLCNPHPDYKLVDELSKTKANTRSVWWWLLVYFCGTIPGCFGLVSLVMINWVSSRKLVVMTYSFTGGLGCLVFSLFCLAALRFHPKVSWFAFYLVLSFLAGTAALYGDWALGVMVNNLLGIPSSDLKYAFWSYFVLKRLTMFSC